ncbi:MAG: serine/threonine protein kinase, partial [Gemmataceae bacterium]|nr:serine/threonine protein kinase [Gemmataceae bacterium]
MTDESIFAAARAIPDPAQRAAYLDRACAGDPALRREVEELLAADAASNLLDRPPAGLPLTGAYTPGPESVSPHDPKADAGAVLGGRYKLVEPIGEGGMGTVWATQQTEPVRRAVAVKLIKAGMDSKAVLARFEAERQALALMDHPNIAKVLDAGAAPDGRPFFVMELVKGVPITRFCDDRRLTPRERLELFIPVCQAVQHAHQKGVIHRDIKPSNVLVALYDDRPVPKVIDFGVAKAAGSPLTDKTLMTGFGAVVGTPEYMSPEQASFNQLDIDTRADIYALGVLLYELLTGSTPVDRKTLGQAALLEVLRIVREVDPPRPSQKLSTADALPSIAANRHTEPRRLAALVKGDLDWIVMKALEKDRTRRYETANGLAADVGRYLAGEPVAAAPPSRTYRVRKFVRRTRGPVMVAAGAVAVLVALVGVLAVGIIQRDAANRKVQAALVRESDARKRTRAALDTLTSDALEGWFTRERVLTPDQKDVLRRLLDQYAAFAEEAGDDPDTKRGQVRALLRVGNIQQALGDRPAAGASLRRAVELAGTAAAPATD